MGHQNRCGQSWPSTYQNSRARCCDEECYETFKELFDPITIARQEGYDHRSKPQSTNMDISQLSTTDIDPEGKYVLTTRVRTGRSVRGFRLAPQIGFEERRKLE